MVRESSAAPEPTVSPTLKMTTTETGVTTSGTVAAIRRELAVVNALMASHPDLTPFGATDYADVPGLGSTVMVHLPTSLDVLKWARTLGALVRDSGRSHYGRTAPTATSASLHDWMWWRVVYADTDALGVRLRLWNLETSGHDRVAELALAGWVRGRAEA
ncbi:hypothetical protein AB0L75_42445 [Streptomyces sp. NPDC052101]|uniref:hypothetical protein n=1 Tax=Streptomyces sp. NPDC052101 TaxID=3155763 RepID=UPI003414328E